MAQNPGIIAFAFRSKGIASSNWPREKMTLTNIMYAGTVARVL